MLEDPEIDIKLLVCGSEGDISKQFALNFVEPNYYVESSQPYSDYKQNLTKKFKDTIQATKKYKHDIVIQSGSDDFADIDFFRKFIKLYKTNTNKNAVYCNGNYDDTTKLGGVTIINIDEPPRGFILPEVNLFQTAPWYSKSSGAYAFTKEALVKLNYFPGNSELAIENKVNSLKIPKFIIRYKYYDLKSDDAITYSNYSAYENRDNEIVPDNLIDDYKIFINSILHDLPQNLSF